MVRYKVATRPEPTKFPLKSPRGAKLATRVWPTEGPPPKALCLLVHGGGWHSGYFDELAQAIVKKGIFCASYDQVCAGYSDPEPGTPKGRVHIDSFDCLVEDVFTAVEWMKKESGTTTKDLPIYLFGESFGGLQVMSAAMDQKHYGQNIAGVVVSGGLMKLKPEFLPPAPVVTILCFLAKYYPRIPMPATDFESTFDDAFGDKEWAKTTRSDEKISTTICPTIGGVAATLGASAGIRARAKTFPVPLLAIHGKRDCRTEPEAMEEFIDQVGPNLATLVMLDTTGHQLLQDTPEITNQCITHIADWLQKEIKK